MTSRGARVRNAARKRDQAQQEAKEEAYKPCNIFTCVPHNQRDFNVWQEMAGRIQDKPKRTELLTGEYRNGTPISEGRQLTRGFLIPRESLMGSESYNSDRDNAQTSNRLACLLENTLIGSQILIHVYGHGWQNVHSLALASKRTWHAVAMNTKIWDVLAYKPRDETVQSPIFVAVAPEYNIGELLQVGLSDPLRLITEVTTSAVAKRATESDTLLLHLLELYWNGWKDMGVFWAYDFDKEQALKKVDKKDLEHFNPSFILTIGSLKSISPISQFVEKAGHRLYQAPISHASVALEKMMVQVWKQRRGLQVLNFHKIPMLDIRLVAIMLHACPQVHTLGIFDCPLIHFGNVIALLDMIWNVNQKRRESGNHRVIAFDFYPRYEKGMPYDNSDDKTAAKTYGLTWGPHNREFVQRGFFAIMLKTYMKAQCMKLDMFSKGKAFGTFLKRVPNLPFAVPHFLKSVEAYMGLPLKDLNEEMTKRRMRVYYNILAPIRTALDDKWRKDWPSWFQKNPTPRVYMCTSCGYEMLEVFFDSTNRPSRNVAANCICSGCYLQRILADENDHFKGPKLGAITKLFPNWNSGEFNDDCPIPQRGQSLISLKTTESKLPPGPAFIPGYGQPDWVRPPVRNHNQSRDSLQNLPSLDDLVAHLADGDPGKGQNISLFPAFHAHCRSLDTYILAIRTLRKQYAQSTDKLQAFSEVRHDRGHADCMDEPQHGYQRDRSDGPPASFNFQSAEDWYFDIYPPTHDEAWMRKRQEKRVRDFW